jgi:hypothetical protein
MAGVIGHGYHVPMLVWLNGPFGVGKTSVAQERVTALPKSLLYDPEPLGSMLRHSTRSVEPVDDFQDLSVWRRLVPEVSRALRQQYPGQTVVMPMTVWRHDYFDELSKALRSNDDLRCFRLTASQATLRRRILDRPSAEGPHDWCLKHLPAGLALMADARFGEEIVTEGRNPHEVAEAIVTLLANTS